MKGTLLTKRSFGVRISRAGLVVAAAGALTLAELSMAAHAGMDPGGGSFPNASGVSRTISVNGPIDPQNPFFQSLGTNGRACITCHTPADGMSITPAHVQARFDATDGLDPLFRPNDGTDSPLADLSSVAARRAACSMLLSKGLIRVGIGIPAGAEFELQDVDDPYGYASAKELSLFRRPLPAANLRFLSAVMWDGRETVQKMSIQPLGGTEAPNVQALLFDLGHQANDATLGHAQAAQNLTDQQKQEIVSFELGLVTAQSQDRGAGSLSSQGAMGGPEALSGFPFYIGINDNVADPHGPFNSNAMLLYQAWESSPDPHRRSIARGEKLFNSKPITITGVKGLNDNPYFGSPAVVTGTCTTCHNTPGVGNHSLAIPLDIGVADASRRTPDLPLYTLRNIATGETVQTTDPGRALITGKWADIGKFKGPILRGLASRPPYFHNGSAATLEDAVEFYDTRFNIGFTQQEKQDLVAFLKTL